MLFSQKEAFSTIEMSFYYSRKNLYFSKYLSSLLFRERDLGFVFVSSKRGFLDYKNVILLESKNFFIFLKGINSSPIFTEGRGSVNMLN